MRRNPDREMEEVQVVPARNGNGAELHEVRGGPLSVKKLKTSFPEPPCETDERNLGCSRNAVKHRLAEESTANANPVKTAGKPPVAPDLQRMGVAGAMQSEITLNN